MSTAPRVSVLMAVFNAQPFLQEAIDGILRQTLDDIELIIVDDCSTDDGWQVIADAAGRDPRVTAIRRDRQGGASAALNQGLAIARGEFVTRQDSDDVSLGSRLAEQVAFLDAHPEVGAVGSSVVLIDHHGEPSSTWRLPETDEEIQVTLLQSMCFCGPTLMVRRQVLEQIRFTFDEALSSSEDYDLCLRVAEVTRLANLPAALYQYRQHPSSVSRSREHQQLARKAAALEQALRRRFGSAPPVDVVRTVARDYVAAAVMAHVRGFPGDERDWLDRAHRLHQPVLEDLDWLGRIIRACSAAMPAGLALERTQSLFVDVLPRRRVLRKLQRRLISERHMSEVFAAGATSDRTHIRRHLWSAISNNPLWLTNRGVLSRLLKDVLA